MTVVTNLNARLTKIQALLDDLTDNPKPSYIIDGQNVQWSAYYRMLSDMEDDLIARIQANQPFETVSQGYT